MQIAVSDTDLQVRGEPGHQDPEIRANRPQKNNFRSFGPQFGLELNGGAGGAGGGPSPSPGSANELTQHC